MALFKIDTNKTTKASIKEKLKKVNSHKKVTRKYLTNGNKVQNAISKLKMLMCDFDLTGLKCVRSLKTLEVMDDFILQLRKNGGIMSIDCEATSLDEMTAIMVGVSIHTMGTDSIYIPINHISYMSGTRIKNQVKPENLKKLLQKFVAEGAKFIYHNASYDIRVIKHNLGIELSYYWDTLIASFILNENESHSLKDLYTKYISDSDKKALKFNQLFKDIPTDFVPIELMFPYAAKDTIMTSELYKFQQQFLNENVEKQDLKDLYLNVLKKVEFPVIQTTINMEERGIYIDQEFASQLKVKYGEMLKGIESEIYAIIDSLKNSSKWLALSRDQLNSLDNPVNLSSPKQVAIILFDVLGYSNGKSRSTAVGALKSIDKEITNLILSHRGVEKLISTYVEKLPEAIDLDGKIHANLNQIGTDTGRYSSSNPNLQNIPSRKATDIRRIFVADKHVPKFLKTLNASDLVNVMIGADYSQQEPRTLAYMSKDKALLESYKLNRDIYATIGSFVYDMPYENCLEFHPETNEMQPEGNKRRDAMKTVVLGIMYGRGINSIAEQLKVDYKKAQQIIDLFYAKFPTVKQWIEDTIYMAKQTGYVTTITGRKRRLPDINLPDYEFSGPGAENLNHEKRISMAQQIDGLWYEEKAIKKKELEQKYNIEIKDNGGFIAHAERQAVNSRIQGSAADITKLAMSTVDNDKVLQDWGYEMFLCVHDELLGTCPYTNVEKVKARVVQLMMEAPKEFITVPMKVDLEVSVRWYGEELEELLKTG